MNTRRDFLRTVALTAAAVAVGPVAAVASVGSVPRSSEKIGMTCAGFMGLRGTAFQMREADGAAETVVLDDVTEYQRAPGIENFAVQFRHESEASLPQGTYRFSHPQMGEFELFVVPQPAVQARGGYVAVFNRLV